MLQYLGLCVKHEVNKCINVFSTQKLRNRKSIINGIYVSVRTISAQAMFGLALACQQADVIEPSINPIGGRIFARPYSELVKPKILIAIKGATAAKT